MNALKYVHHALLLGGPVRERRVRKETSMTKVGALQESCYMSSASQSHDPVEIDSVDQPPNTRDH